MPLLFLALNVFAYSLLLFCIFPLWQELGQVWACIILEIISMVFWVRCLIIDGGIVQKPKNVSFLELLKLIDPI